MAGERYTKSTISQASRCDGTSLDNYYGKKYSFQYSENINADDELHGIKLAQKVQKTSNFANCQLVSAGDRVLALNTQTGEVKKFTYDNRSSGGQSTGTSAVSNATKKGILFTPGVIFQDYLWYGTYVAGIQGLQALNVTGGASKVIVPHDHLTDTDEDIMDPTKLTDQMQQGITAILNYNNTRLVVGVGNEIRVYYPELEAEYNKKNPSKQEKTGKVGWKKTMVFEEGCTIVGLTCTFEYLKVRVQDEGWNTKIYYYQGNNNLKSTYVYNSIDLTGTKIIRAYSINSVDYFIASLDGTEGYVTFNKMVGNTPVQLLKQRAGLSMYDVNFKAPYFVGPCGMDAPYLGGSYYVADAYGIFKFSYTADNYDTGYMKWKLRSSTSTSGIPRGVCINKNFIYVSDGTGCRRARLYDTGIDGYQDTGIMISRELEGDMGGTITKMLDEIRLHYELNPQTTGNGTIDVYVSPNNTWQDTNPSNDGSDGWYHVMHISQSNHNTRVEKTNILNNMVNGNPAFEFDRQTITYCIKITVGSQKQATPIVRQLDLEYRIKGKTNNIYDIQN